MARPHTLQHKVSAYIYIYIYIYMIDYSYYGMAQYNVSD